MRNNSSVHTVKASHRKQGLGRLFTWADSHWMLYNCNSVTSKPECIPRVGIGDLLQGITEQIS